MRHSCGYRYNSTLISIKRLGALNDENAKNKLAPTAVRDKCQIPDYWTEQSFWNGVRTLDNSLITNTDLSVRGSYMYIHTHAIYSNEQRAHIFGIHNATSIYSPGSIYNALQCWIQFYYNGSTWIPTFNTCRRSVSGIGKYAHRQATLFPSFILSSPYVTKPHINHCAHDSQLVTSQLQVEQVCTNTLCPNTTGRVNKIQQKWQDGRH